MAKKKKACIKFPKNLGNIRRFVASGEIKAGMIVKQNKDGTVSCW